jgi:hypothetical protein
MRPRKANALPRVVQLLVINGVIGASVGCASAAGMLVTDTGGMATLISQSGSYAAAGVLLFGGFGLTFASLAMASAVMLLPRK